MTIPPPLYFDLFLWWVLLALIVRDPLFVPVPATGFVARPRGGWR